MAGRAALRVGALMLLIMLSFAGAVVLLVWWWRRRRAAAEVHPLASYDSGVRSPFRVPGRITHRRGLR